MVSYQDVPAEPRTDETVKIMWQANVDTAVSYEVYRNRTLVAELKDDGQGGEYFSAYYSLGAGRDGLEYSVIAMDSCGSKTRIGLVGKPIRVTGRVVGNNDMSVISYSGYEELLLGSNELSYSLQTFEYNEWVELNNQTSTNEYEDPKFLNFVNEGLQLQKSYRVVGSIATSSEKTISNILRLPYKPILFIPTAFSPNADGLNDVYRPVTFGIEHYTMSIYDRYGQKVAELDQNSAGWDAADYAPGTYMVVIHAKGTYNLWYNLKETVTVVR